MRKKKTHSGRPRAKGRIGRIWSRSKEELNAGAMTGAGAGAARGPGQPDEMPSAVPPIAGSLYSGYRCRGRRLW